MGLEVAKCNHHQKIAGPDKIEDNKAVRKRQEIYFAPLSPIISMRSAAGCVEAEVNDWLHRVAGNQATVDIVTNSHNRLTHRHLHVISLHAFSTPHFPIREFIRQAPLSLRTAHWCLARNGAPAPHSDQVQNFKAGFDKLPPAQNSTLKHSLITYVSK